MKFSIDREVLVRGLAHIQTIVEQRATLPILANALLRVTESDLTLAATDLEVGNVTTLPAEIETPGVVTLAARKLYEIAREFSESEVRFSVAEGARVKIECGAAQFTLLSIAPEEYPTIPGLEGVETTRVDGSLIAELIDHTLYATSTDETRYNLNGVLMEVLDDGRLRGVATDGHRMAQIDCTVPEPLEFLDRKIIVPRKGIAEIRKLVDDPDEGVEMGLGDNFLIVRRPGLILSCRLIDGEFPNYRQVVPSEFKARIVVDRGHLLRAARRMALMTHDRARGLRFVLDSGRLELQVQNPDMGEAREAIPLDYSGDRFDTSFNAHFIQEAVTAMNSKEIAIELLDELTAAVLRPADNPDQLAIVMPMRL
ncbi:MAG: DNA polymerase III subunit beta [Myxococcota bacterium]